MAVYFIVISLFFHFIKKDKPTVSVDLTEKNRQEIYKVINDPKLNQTQEGKLTILAYRSILCATIGEACTDNPADADKNFNHSLFGFLTNLLVLPYANPPASGIYWVYSGLQNAGFVPKTYAAEGIGFASIKSLNKIWKTMRDISFMILVLVVITIGFMIMFRAKISPQAVISIENALPRIVIILILISLSFAIAGFLIDLMYLSIAIIVSILSPTIGLDVNKTIGDSLTYGSSDIGRLFALRKNIFSTTWDIASSFKNLLGLWTEIPWYLISGYFTIFHVAPFIMDNILHRFHDFFPELTTGIGVNWGVLKTVGGFMGFVLSLGIGGALTNFALMPLLITFLIFVTILFLIFRIIFILLNAYIKIIILIIFSPLVILASAFPGQSPFSFESWLKNLIVELFTFPLVITIFMIGHVIAHVSSSDSPLFTPPFLFSINNKAFVLFTGMAILFMAPDLIKTFKQLILPKPLPLQQAGLGVFFAAQKSLIEVGISEAGKWGSIGMHVAPVRKFLQRFVPGFFHFKD